MTNKEFQEKLKQYPDDMEIFMDTNFGWNTPNNEGYVDPGFTTHSDESGDIWGLELVPNGEYAPMNVETIKLITDIMKDINFIEYPLNFRDWHDILDIFRMRHE